jgi:heme-degrading monooxygenase HmoA
VIARVWRGITPASKADEYLEYLRRTGLRDYKSTEGNRGVYVLRRLTDDRAEFVLISLWESFDAVRAFAGSNIENAVYYPEDKKFLLELEPNVTHDEVLVEPE